MANISASKICFDQLIATLKVAERIESVSANASNSSVSFMYGDNVSIDDLSVGNLSAIVKVTAPATTATNITGTTITATSKF